MKKTRIIATFGPAIAKQSIIKKLVEAGVNLFRINCSHGTTEDFKKAAALIRKSTRSATYPVGLLFDICGPKLRLDRFDDKLQIKAGDTIILTSGKTDLAKNQIAVNHPSIISSVKKSERLFIDDGNLVFDITKTGRTKIEITAQNHGTISGGKGINLPDSNIKIPTITEKDKTDIKTAVECSADYIALSFVRSADDIITAQRLIRKDNGHQAVIAKLEKQEAIADLDNIMLLADGVMIARGDLGVELPFEALPRIQKEIISLANRHHKPVIVATQMLESMRYSPRATRAEINDVATAVFDYADCVMLSAETATGEYPIIAVKTMAKVCVSTENSLPEFKPEIQSHLIRSEITHAIAQSVIRTKKYCPAKIIFAFTTSGFTAAVISNLFPAQPIIALSPDQKVLNKLTLFRSVYPIKIKQPDSFQNMLSIVNSLSKKYNLAQQGDEVVITGGAPFGSTAPTNFMMIYKIGSKK